MLSTHSTFCGDWARAVRRFAPVTEIIAVRDFSPDSRPVPGSRVFARWPHREGAYEALMTGELPYRVFRRYADAIPIRRIAGDLHEVVDMGSLALVHAHFYSLGRHARPLAALLGLPYVVTEHSTGFSGLARHSTMGERSVRLAHRVFHDAAGVFPVSTALLTEIASRRIETNRFHVLPNPVDDGLFQPSAMTGEAPPVEPVDVLAVGWLAHHKRFDLVLRAVAEAGERSDRLLHLVIIGAGPEEGLLRGVAAGLTHHVHVHFAGALPRDEVARLMRTARALVSMSEYETSGVAIVEAQLSGESVIATDVGGVRESSSPVGRVLVPSGDWQAAGRALAAVLDSRSPSRHEIASAARDLRGLAAGAERIRLAYRAVLGDPW